MLGSNQDGSREFISLLACICADGTALPPALIYQGESGDLQDNWLDDFDSSSEEAYFAVSEKGWTTNELGFSWLTKVFDPYTKPKVGKSKRLLLTDGHSSHINLRFIDYCDESGIILIILPPHSTHRLQPLDVGIFAPLANAYSYRIDQFIQSSSGFSRITKRLFWQLFHSAWQSALTLQNIRSAFASPGIYPFKPSKVLDMLKKKTPSPISSDNEHIGKTPGSVRAIRRTIKAIQQEGGEFTQATQKMMKAAEKLVVQNEILQHQYRGVLNALIGEKKRRKRGKPMGLFDKDNPGEAQFFSPSKIEAVRQRAQDIESQKEQERVEAVNRRTQKALIREQKAQEVQDRREKRIQEREEKKLQKELEKEQHRMAQEAKKQAKQDQERQKKQMKLKRNQSKRILEHTEEVPAKRQKTGVSRSGREITLPIRFLD